MELSLRATRQWRSASAEVFFVLFLLLFYRSPTSVATWVSIDCGATESSYTDSVTGINWVNDGDYVGSGLSRRVSDSVVDGASEQMRTLRYFSDQNKNCYRFELYRGKYLIRAGFFYGDYDGLRRPPSFDLSFDANRWATVVTSMDEPVFYEMIYAVRELYFYVCVSRTHDDQTPFISSLEVRSIGDSMYPGMNELYGWFMSYRVHFGVGDVIAYPDDEYSRVWKPFSTPNLNTLNANFTELLSNSYSSPPLGAMLHAVEGRDPSSSILLSFDFPQSSRSNYVVLYFTEVIELTANQRRSFNVLIDGRDYGIVVTPQFQIVREVNVTARPASGMMNLSLTPITSNSTLPPLINALEIYTMSQPLVAGTHPTDVSELSHTIMDSFESLKGWRGDPCLPTNTTWKWVRCNNQNPPRVTALYLSHYGLKGDIPDFNKMEALEIILMDHNALTGKIPSFLGDLPNLKQLDLSHNKLTGDVPQNLKDSNITFK
ncbi:probable LRR receptor-like serine/threonine-protein kinase At1g51880 [Typha latifolia]|uniref:probable LRR receptor-like serine/threonine-protein kinase At1g51880 n=1 Tax=Typha latifolia TaxID=4733 RepID=UPI003C300D1E